MPRMGYWYEGEVLALLALHLRYFGHTVAGGYKGVAGEGVISIPDGASITSAGGRWDAESKGLKGRRRRINKICEAGAAMLQRRFDEALRNATPGSWHCCTHTAEPLPPRHLRGNYGASHRKRRG